MDSQSELDQISEESTRIGAEKEGLGRVGMSCKHHESLAVML